MIVDEDQYKVASQKIHGVFFMGINISPFYVMEALSDAEKLAASGHDIIHLNVGQPSAKLPAEVIALAQASLALENQGYTHSLGMLSLREAIADFYTARYGVDVPVSRIAVTVGSSIGCALALMAAFTAGQKVGISVPYYPAYPNMLKALNLEPHIIRTDASSRYQLTPAMLLAEKKSLSGLMIASPSNPAGTVINPADLADICQICTDNNITLISDEIYHGITYGDTMADTALRYSGAAIIVNSFSKYFIMPGFRLGWVVMPEHLMRDYECLLQNFVISAPQLSQHIALAMLKQTRLLDEEVRRYEQNRAIMLEAMQDLGFTDISTAEGAFYLYANCTALADNSKALCDEILLKAHVSIVAGLDFDAEQGAHMVRVSYCGDSARIEEAVKRLKHWKATRKQAA